MKERSFVDQNWVDTRNRSAEHNRLLFEGLRNGKFFRRAVTARRAFQAIFNPPPMPRHPQEGGDFVA